MHSVQDAIEHCRDQEKAFIIGGGDIFKLALPYTDTLIITALEREVEGDVYFEPIKPDQFREIHSQDCDEEEPYRIIHYERVKKAS